MHIVHMHIIYINMHSYFEIITALYKVANIIQGRVPCPSSKFPQVLHLVQSEYGIKSKDLTLMDCMFHCLFPTCISSCNQHHTISRCRTIPPLQIFPRYLFH